MIFKRLAVFCFCLFLIHFCTFLICAKVKTSDASQGIPDVFSNQEAYICEISDYCVKDGQIFLLYSDKGVIQIFDEEGTYQKSYAYFKTKGQSELRIMKEAVLMFDERRNCYKFVSGSFQEYQAFLNYEEYLRIGEECEERYQQISSEKGVYYLRGASLARKNIDGTEEVIIKRAWLATLFQGKMLSGIWFGLVILSCSFFWISKKLRK